MKFTHELNKQPVLVPTEGQVHKEGQVLVAPQSTQLDIVQNLSRFGLREKVVIRTCLTGNSNQSRPDGISQWGPGSTTRPIPRAQPHDVLRAQQPASIESSLSHQCGLFFQMTERFNNPNSW